MKIESAIRNAYSRQREMNVLIQREVEATIKGFDKKWYFFDRLKGEESFAQKVETGQVTDNLEIDDFYACTIVVRNSSEIEIATEFVERLFEVHHRRPMSPKKTKTRPSDFQFDDLRLYAKLKPSIKGDRVIDEIIFEIQIKTFLQHAWGVATHDLTYKSDSVQWSRLRLANQIRAMLEHAELSIERFEELSGSSTIAKEHDEYIEIARIINEIKKRWEPNGLPKDLQRLARTLRGAFIKLDVKLEDVLSYLDVDTANGSGAAELNLSPYNAIMQSVLRRVNLNVDIIKRRRPSGKIMLSNSIRLDLIIKGDPKEIFRFF